MRRSLIQKAGTIFLSTATGFCFWSAEAAFGQDPAGADEIQRRLIEMYAREGRTLPGYEEIPASPSGPAFAAPTLEPPRPAIRPEPQAPPARQVEELPAPPLTPASRADGNPQTGPQIVPRFAAPPSKLSSAPAITAGPSTSALPPQAPLVPPTALPPGYLQPPAPPEETEEDAFVMPILSVPTMKSVAGPEVSVTPPVTTYAEPAEPASPAIENQAPSASSRTVVEFSSTWTPISEIASAAPALSSVPVAEVPSGHWPVGLKGYCPVTLREGRTQVKGSERFASPWQGTLYYMASAEARWKFEINPEFYAPALGGLDVIKSSHQGQKVEGSLEHAIWYRRQLYLFEDENSLKTFTADPQKYLPQN